MEGVVSGREAKSKKPPIFFTYKFTPTSKFIHFKDIDINKHNLLNESLFLDPH